MSIVEELIIDAGSTKTQWLQLPGCEIVTTTGINPVFHTTESLISELRMAAAELPDTKVRKINWYGAGCGTTAECHKMKQGLQKIFGTDAEIEVGSDLLMAARSTAGTAPGIVCILGTGSNSGLYDGHNIIDNIPPLGYILGDEGSGAALGRRLANALLKRRISENISDEISQKYQLDKANVQQKVYAGQHPNRYLASLAPVLLKYSHSPEVEALILEEFCLFLNNNVLRYADVTSLPIHFAGGVASAFSTWLKVALSRCGLRCGRIIQSPLRTIMQQKLANL